MTKLLLLLLPLWGWANGIDIANVIQKPLGKIVRTNAQITQLSDQKQEIVSRLAGHVEAYYVKAGEVVKRGDKVVLIESIALSKLTADYLALIQQIQPARAQVSTTRKLYKKGLSSKNDLNTHIIALETLRAQKNALASQLQTLGIQTSTLKKATDKFTLYAHADGVVGKILVSLHSNVNAQTPLMTLVNHSGYYATAFLSVDDAMQITPNTTGKIDINNHTYNVHFVQLLPSIDTETQRAKVLFSIDKSPKNLLLGSFMQIAISLPPTKKMLMVKKTALTLFQGEWVVFIKTKEEKEEEHRDAKHIDDAHDDEEHEEDELHHENHEHEHEEEHHEDEAEEEHHGHHHESHEEKKVPYKAQVVEIIAYYGDEVAIRGLKVNQEYVSSGVYFVKSMLLKSSLGGHGH
jgi:RND family efflux transporter MFP subunit